jgi:hypothetical protein
MSFLKGVKDQIEVNVTVKIASDLGELVEVPFKATFKRLKRSAMLALIEKNKTSEISDDEILTKYLVGWRDLEGADGEPVAFSKKNLAEVCESSDYLGTLIEAFLSMHGRYQELERKN